MKKTSLVIFIVLMAIAMLAIIAMQVYWVNNAYNIKKQEFNRQVTEAMNKAAQHLDDMRISGFINEKMDSAGLNFNHLVNANSAFFKQQFLTFKKTEVIKRSAKGARPFTMESPFGTIIRKNSTPWKSNGIIIHKDSTGYNHVFTQNISVMDNQADSSTGKAKRFSTVMNKMAFEWLESSVPIEKQLNTDTIQKTIELQLKDKGISLPFEFALLTDGNKKPSLQSKGFSNANSNIYSVSLSPTSVKPTSDKLEVVFYNPETWLLNSIKWLLAISGVLIVVVLIAFGGSVYFIISQKRIADIKNDFINNMTHEFKTPLATIGVAISALKKSETINDLNKVAYYSDVIEEEGLRMNEHIEQVLFMALLDKKQLSIENNRVDMHALIEKSIKNILPLAQAKNGTINFKPGALKYTVTGDSFHLGGVINNLLDNAIKYSINNPEIIISTTEQNGGLLISIADNGIGMNKHEQKKVFEKFYRVTTGNIHNQKGFGLGLSYVKAIILAHGGTIEVESTLGKGSTFKIYLPLG